MCSTYNTERIITSGLQLETLTSWHRFLQVPVHYWIDESPTGISHRRKQKTFLESIVLRENKKGWQVPSDVAQYKETAEKNNVILQGF